MPRTIVVILLGLAIVIAGCGARQANPTAERSDLDGRLSCAHLQGEYAANTARIEELAREVQRRGGDNFGMVLAAGLAGAVFIDSGETQRNETAALERRNARLRELAVAQPCAL